MIEGVIFISHAAKDEPIIREFFNLLQTGCSLRGREISCTSIEGSNVSSGEDFVEWIRKHLVCADLVILFITPNYLNSRFCLAEMGAAWALEKSVYPLVTSEVDRDLGTVMLGRQTERVNPVGLDNLYQKISDLFPEADSNVGHWNGRKDVFLENFCTLSPELPKPEVVSREELVTVENELASARQINIEDRDRIRELEDQMKLLEQAKDADEVESIRRQFDSEESQYKNHVRTIHDELQQLDSVEVRCLYASISRQGWQPDNETSLLLKSEIDRALRKGSIRCNEEDDYTEFFANTEHPTYQNLNEVTSEFNCFLEEEASGQLIERLKQETETFIGLEYQDYWENTLYGKRFPD